MAFFFRSTTWIMNNTNDYEKIQLSKQDLKHLYEQIYSKLSYRLNLHLPTSNNDPLKENVIDILEKYMLEVFDMAQNALIVDGEELHLSENFDTSTSGSRLRQSKLAKILQIDSESASSPSQDEVEPFDQKKNLELREILQNIELETIKVTALRRELPKLAQLVYDELVRRTDREVTSILEEIDGVDLTETVDVSTPGIDAARINSIQTDYEETLSRLVELKKVLPGQRAEIDRLDDTINFLEALNREPS